MLQEANEKMKEELSSEIAKLSQELLEQKQATQVILILTSFPHTNRLSFLLQNINILSTSIHYSHHLTLNILTWL